MDFFAIIKQLESLGMVGLALAISGGLVWVIVHREKDGSIQLKQAIEALTLAIESSQKTTDLTLKHLQQNSQDVKILASDIHTLKEDVGLIKQALITVGVKSITEQK